VRWGDLSSHFRRFQRVLERSPDVLIRGGKSYGRFTDISYDGVADELTVRAKAALLNLFAKLTSMPKAPGSSVDWFSWIRQIATFGRERLVAIVAPEMAKAVRDIKSDLPKHEFYKHTAAENHYKNFPERYHPLKSKMYSIKTDEDHGNLQITIAPGTDPDSGGELFLADIDIDENGKLLRHLLDVFLVHHFSGGTHPFDIHEYLHLAYPKVELGYQLV
jgi:hypothetical protein